MSAWDAVKPWVAKIAPMLGTALGGPLGGAAGALLGSALGIKDASPASIQAALQSGSLTGEQIVAMRKAEDDFQVQMATLNIKSVQDLEALAVQDRASARDREIKTGDNWTPRGLAAVVVLGFLWAVYYVLSGRVSGLKDPATVAMIGTLVGYISAKADTIIGYYFGSSAGSDRKTDLLGGRP